MIKGIQSFRTKEGGRTADKRWEREKDNSRNPKRVLDRIILFTIFFVNRIILKQDTPFKRYL